MADLILVVCATRDYGRAGRRVEKLNDEVPGSLRGSFGCQRAADVRRK